MALALLAPAAALPSLAIVVGLIVTYALASRVEFEVGTGSSVPTQVVLVPMLFLLPPAAVPVAVAAGFLLGEARAASATASRPSASSPSR